MHYFVKSFQLWNYFSFLHWIARLKHVTKIKCPPNAYSKQSREVIETLFLSEMADLFSKTAWPASRSQPTVDSHPLSQHIVYQMEVINFSMRSPLSGILYVSKCFGLFCVFVCWLRCLSVCGWGGMSSCYGQCTDHRQGSCALSSRYSLLSSLRLLLVCHQQSHQATWTESILVFVFMTYLVTGLPTIHTSQQRSTSTHCSQSRKREREREVE